MWTVIARRAAFGSWRRIARNNSRWTAKLFAVNSALHSFLIVSYAREDGVSLDVGFYYMANALGRLVGTWFSEGAGMDEWERQLSFVYEPQHPAQVRVSMGGELGLCEVFSIPDSAPRPAEVPEATGKVAYQLRYPYFNSNQPAAGLLIVQVTGPETIKVELFVGSQATDAEFTAAARTYIR